MGADSKPISHDEIAEDGVLDPLTEGFERLIPIINTADTAMISFAKSTMTYLSGLRLSDATIESVQKLNDACTAGNSIAEQSIKLEKLKAQASKEFGNAQIVEAKLITARNQSVKSGIALEQQQNKIKQDNIKLTKEQIAQKQIDGAVARDEIALLKAKATATNESVGTLQRVAAANTVLRNEQKTLNLTTAEGIARNAEINTQLNLNNATIKGNADALKQQAMNVGNYSKSFSTSLRPIEELVRGLGYALGIPIEGLREYTGVIRGASDLNDHHKKTIEGVKTATEEQAVAQTIQIDETGNVIAAKEANIAVTEAETAAQEASIPVIGWVIGGLALLAGGIAIAVEATEAHKKAIEERSVAVDGSIIRDKKQRDDWNEYLTTMHKLSDEYEVLVGNMGDYQAATEGMEDTASVKVRDLTNEMKANIQTQTNWFGSLAGFWLNLSHAGDEGYAVKDRVKELTDQYTGAAGVITRITNELAANEKIAAQKRDDDVIKSNFDLLDSEIDNIEKIADLKNDAQRNDYERNKQALINEQYFSSEKIKNKIAEQAALHKANENDISGLQQEQQTNTSEYGGNTPSAVIANADIQKKIDNIKSSNTLISNEHQKLIDALAVIDESYDDKKKKLDADYVLEHRKQMLGEIDELAKLSKDKIAAANADYAKQKNDTADNAQLTPEERQAQEVINFEAYQEQLYNISREKEKAELDLLKEHDSTILDSYVKEVETAKDSYAEELFNYDGLLHNKEISLDQYNQYQIDAKARLNEALYQLDLKNREKRKEAGLANDTAAAGNTVKEDSLKPTSQQQIYQDESADNTAKENQALAPIQSASDQAAKRIKDAQRDITTTGNALQNAQSEQAAGGPLAPTDADIEVLQKKNDDAKQSYEDAFNDKVEADDKIATTTKTFNDNQKALDEANYNYKIDQAKKAEEELTNAVAEGLAKRAEMQQQADQENIDTHSRLMSEQEALAAGGRANALAAETAETDEAEEKKLQDAKKAQKAQMAISLMQTYFSLLAAFAKQGNNAPEIKAMEETLAAKGLASAIAGYATGVEGLEGPGTGTSDSIIARLSRGESIITADGTGDNPGLATAMNEGIVPEYFKDIYLPQFLAANNIGTTTKTIVSHDPALLKEIRGLRASMESRPVQQIDARSPFRIIETMERNGRIEKINHYRRGGRDRL